jgi:hypothetical protein
VRNAFDDAETEHSVIRVRNKVLERLADSGEVSDADAMASEQ